MEIFPALQEKREVGDKGRVGCDRREGTLREEVIRMQGIRKQGGRGAMERRIGHVTK